MMNNLDKEIQELEDKRNKLILEQKTALINAETDRLKGKYLGKVLTYNHVRGYGKKSRYKGFDAFLVKDIFFDPDGDYKCIILKGSHISIYYHDKSSYATHIEVKLDAERYHKLEYQICSDKHMSLSVSEFEKIFKICSHIIQGLLNDVSAHNDFSYIINNGEHHTISSCRDSLPYLDIPYIELNLEEAYLLRGCIFLLDTEKTLLATEGCIKYIEHLRDKDIQDSIETNFLYSNYGIKLKSSRTKEYNSLLVRLREVVK